jgi:hypothetical protein
MSKVRVTANGWGESDALANLDARSTWLLPEELAAVTESDFEMLSDQSRGRKSRAPPCNLVRSPNDFGEVRQVL